MGTDSGGYGDLRKPAQLRDLDTSSRKALRELGIEIDGNSARRINAEADITANQARAEKAFEEARAIFARKNAEKVKAQYEEIYPLLKSLEARQQGTAEYLGGYVERLEKRLESLEGSCADMQRQIYALETKIETLTKVECNHQWRAVSRTWDRFCCKICGKENDFFRE